MGQDQEKADSVYDFLYVDHKRIGLLISQLGESGVLTELIRETNAGSESGRKLDFKIVAMSAKQDEATGQTRRFDPQWLIPLTFLDQIKDRLKRDINNAVLGDLVLAEGALWLTDTKQVQTMYSRDFLRTIAIERVRAKTEEDDTDFDPDMVDLELDLITNSPSQVHMHLDTSSGTVWATLRSSGLITPPEEIAVKHGVIVEGMWYVVGIKDANPEPGRTLTDGKSQELADERFPDKPVMADVIHLAEATRRLFGRPYDAVGIAPLLIFRPVGE